MLVSALKNCNFDIGFAGTLQISYDGCRPKCLQGIYGLTFEVDLPRQQPMFRNRVPSLWSAHYITILNSSVCQEHIGFYSSLIFVYNKEFSKYYYNKLACLNRDVIPQLGSCIDILCKSRSQITLVNSGNIPQPVGFQLFRVTLLILLRHSLKFRLLPSFVLESLFMFFFPTCEIMQSGLIHSFHFLMHPLIMHSYTANEETDCQVYLGIIIHIRGICSYYHGSYSFKRVCNFSRFIQ